MACGRHAKLWLIGGLVVAHTVAAAGAVTWWAVGRAVPAPDGNLETLGVYGTVPPFSLTERSGRPITREDLRGLVWVVDFIYTECTETCPLQSLEFARLQHDFGRAADLRLVSITVDPEHDTTEVLRAYAGRYGADDRWWFLTGDKRGIACLAQEGFRLGVVDPAAPTAPECRKAIGLGPAPAWASHGSGGLVMHSARVVLVDRAGVIRAYHPTTDAESMGRLHANLRQLLAAESR
jgi:cytochrome oxidase Cu insertion factor (SCO1/SenC/PrrC family)